MNPLIGKKESSSSILFLALPVIIFSYLSKSLLGFNSGSWINFVLCFSLAFLLLFLIRNSFKDTGENKVLIKITELIFFLYVSSLSLSNYTLSVSSLASVCGNSGLNEEYISFFIIIISLICALCGIEGITRFSFVAFGIFSLILIVMCLVSFKGWDYENIAPLLGNNIRSTFLDLKGVKVFAPVMCLWFLKSKFRNRSEAFKSSKQSIIRIFFLGFLTIFVCILSIPYPMGSLYTFSLEGIFSIAKSGAFFHRFEIILVLAVSLVSLVCTSIGIYLSSSSLSRLTNSGDSKAFCIVYAFLFFILNINFGLDKLYEMTADVLSAILYILLLIASIKNTFHAKRVKS